MSDKDRISSRCEKFAQNLRLLRDERVKELNISIMKLYDDIGINRRTMNNYLNGKSKPSLDSILRLADYFEVSFDWLVGESPIRHSDTKSEELSLGLSDKAISKLRLMKSGKVPYKPKPSEFDP
jgi:transcriptional regulator with XRE-family HTH domain